jgi:hypothetical protein
VKVSLQRTHVELPAKERHRESLFQQEAVSEVPRLRRQVALLRATHDRERLIAAAVDDFEKHRAARPARVLRPEKQHVGRKLDQPVGVPRNQVEVRDATVGRELRVDGEMDTADDPFVRAPISRRCTSMRITSAVAASATASRQTRNADNAARSHSRHGQRKWMTLPVIAPRSKPETR